MTNEKQHFQEIRFHGRGGQGTVSAAALLALAAFDDGFEAQAFVKISPLTQDTENVNETVAGAGGR